MKNIHWLMNVRKFGPILGFFCVIIGIVGLIFLRNTIMEVDFYGGNSYGYLQSDKSYSIGASSYAQNEARVRGTICLDFIEFDSQEVLRRNISLFFDTDEEDTSLSQETYKHITDIQVDKSGNYLLSYEPSMTETSGKITLQDPLIRSLLGVDEVVLIIVGFAVIIMSAVVIPKIALYHKQ